MKLHRHYKNKPYAVRGIVKHSETLEDLVLYEPLYDNPTAKLWVRPRTMFEESIVIDGREVPRFAKVPLKIDEFTEVGAHQEAIVANLSQEIFGTWDPEKFRSRLENPSRVHLLVASIDDKPVAYKLGYELDRSCFYSWLGGTLLEFRGLGIANDLMERQHEWCRAQGYQKVRTKTKYRSKAMLILNIKTGFEIVGYDATMENNPKIIFEKTL